MSSYLDELEQELARRPGEPITAADLLKAVRAQAQAFEEIIQHRGTLAQALADIVEHRDTLVETVGFVNALQDRLRIVDELPVEAPLGSLIRLRVGTVAQRAAVYTGNGPGQPLGKLMPVAV